MAKVQDLMTKNVIACQEQTSIQEAARLLYLNGLTGMPVLNAKDQLVGIITEGDLVKIEGRLHLPITIGFLGSIVALANPVDHDDVQKQLQELLATQVGALMTKQVAMIAPDAPIEEAAELFLHKKINPVPVVDNGKLVGIISRADIVKLLAGDKELREGQWKELTKKNYNLSEK